MSTLRINRLPLLLSLLLGGLLCPSSWLEAAGPGQMPALVLEQFVDDQWQTPTRVVAWGDNYHGQANVPAGLNNVVAIAAGGSHYVALKSDGSVFAWGDNTYGQTTVPSSLSNGVAIVAGWHHTVTLKSDGNLVAWGLNSSGQTNVPTGLNSVVAIAAGASHTIALKSDGRVVAWGHNGYGQTNVPAGLVDVIAVAAGSYHSIALKSNGSVVAWGYDRYGQNNVPSDLRGVVAIAAGGYHNIAIKKDGSVVAWGNNYYGQTTIPAGLSSVVAIAAGHAHTIALKNNDSVVAWGDNYFDQTNLPPDLSDVVAVAACDTKNVALTSLINWQNTVIGSRTNVLLRLTNPSVNIALTGLQLELPASTKGQFSLASAVPTTLAPKESVEIEVIYAPLTAFEAIGKLQVFADGFNSPLVASTVRVGHAQASLVDESNQPLSAEGSSRVVAWGGNGYGQTSVPMGLGNVAAIAAGGHHTVALNGNGRIIGWGDNYYGQITAPVSLSTVAAIAAGGAHTVALKSNGQVVAWGYNSDGQTKVPAGLSGIVAIAAGGDHTVALKSSGQVVAWGCSDSGQTKVPAGLKSVIAIAAGGHHTVALKSNGKVVAWGNNYFGQTKVPAGLNGVVAIAAGGYHTLALKGDGHIVAWGDNGYYQISVPARLNGVVAIAAGGSHSVALKSDSSVVSWGNDYYGYGQTRVPVGLSGVVSIAANGSNSVALVEAMSYFQCVQLGSTRNHTIFIKDTGALTLKGVSVVIEGLDADQFSLLFLPATTIAVGKQSPLTLRFAPTRIGPLNATLKIYSNAPDSPLIMPIRGTGSYEITAQRYGKDNKFTYAPLRLERATGLMLQKLSFTNTTGVSLQGLRLVLSNLASGVTLYSSSAGRAPGTFEVLYTKAIAPNETVTFDLVYHDPKRRATASIQPVIKAQALEEAVPTPGPVTGTNVPLLRVQKLAQGPALEWNSKAGSTYVVEYSDDAGKTWSSAVHRLTSRGTRLFWIDRGQPETFSAPIVGTRSYRVKRL